MKGFSSNKPSNNQPEKEKIAVEGVLHLLMKKVMNAAFLPNVAHDETYELLLWRYVRLRLRRWILQNLPNTKTYNRKSGLNSQLQACRYCVQVDSGPYVHCTVNNKWQALNFEFSMETTS